MSVETIQIKKIDAIEAWKKGDSKMRLLLESLFGKETFASDSIIDRVKTYADVCDILGVKPDNETGWLSAVAKLANIVIVLNEGWTPDWTDHNQEKWYPFFNKASKPSGGFSFCGCCCLGSGTFVGSRLCFKSKSIAEHAAKTFLEIYKDYFVIE